MLFSCLESMHEEMRSNAGRRWSLTVTCSADAEKQLPARVRERYPHARIIETLMPRDSSGSHNRVLRDSRARYIWLLNDDIIFLSGAIARVTAFMERPENSRVAMVGPQLLDPDGRASRSGYGFPSMKAMLLKHAGFGRVSEVDVVESQAPAFGAIRLASPRVLASNPTREVDTIPEGCIALRANAVRQTGLMPEEAIPRASQIDWHRRIGTNGWNMVLLADASVIHYGALSSSAGLRERKRRRLEEALFFFRNGSPPIVFSMFCASLLALFGARAMLDWMRGDRPKLRAERGFAEVVWDELAGRAARPGSPSTDADPNHALH